MGERSVLLRAFHEHPDRSPNALIDQDRETLFLIAKKDGAAATGRSHGAHLHFDNGHTSI
jgi:hypothetical protein